MMYLLGGGFSVAWDEPSPWHFKFIDVITIIVGMGARNAWCPGTRASIDIFMARWFLRLRNLVVHKKILVVLQEITQHDHPRYRAYMGDRWQEWRRETLASTANGP